MFFRNCISIIAALCILLTAPPAQSADGFRQQIRPPAVPLVTSDPYFSI